MITIITTRTVSCFCLISHCLKEILHVNVTPKETNEVTKAKENTFSLVPDVDIAESVFFNGKLKITFQPIPF